jgi:hypothetical protein
MPTPPDPKAKYGAAIIPRKPPTLGIDNGKLIARVGLLEFLDLDLADQGEVTFSDPFTKNGYTRTLYPGGPSIPVNGTNDMVVSVGRLNSLNSGQRWKLVIGGQAYGIRVTSLRVEDLQEALKGATGISQGDYIITQQGGTYPLKDETPSPTVQGALGADMINDQGTTADPISALISA